MTYYNLSFMDNTTSIAAIATGVNTNSNQLFAIMFLISTYIVLFIALSRFELPNIIVADNFIISLLAGVMYGLKWISGDVLIIPVTLLAVSIFIKLLIKT